MSELMKYPKEGATGSAAPGITESDPDLSRVRAILFGEQLAEYEQNIAALSHRLTADTNQLRALVSSRLADLEHTILAELAEVKAEVHAFTAQAVAELSDELKRVSAKVESQSADVNRLVDERFLELAYRMHALDLRLRDMTGSESHGERAFSEKILTRILGQSAVHPDAFNYNGHLKHTD